MFGLSGQACYGPRLAAVATVQGDYTVFDAGQWFPDRLNDPRYKRPECILIWGYNIHATCPDNLFGHWDYRPDEKGDKNYLRRSPTLMVRLPRQTSPGFCAPAAIQALAMGFLNVIIKEKLYDPKFAKTWTNGTHLIRTDSEKTADRRPSSSKAATLPTT